MIKSVWRISFIVTTGPRVGEEIVLLDHGDRMEAEPKLPVAQGATASAPIFSPWTIHSSRITTTEELYNLFR